MQNKNVQIPYELFFQLLQFFLMDNYDGEEIIRLGLEKKLDAMMNREVYSKSKTAPTEEEREKFRQEYLDRRGIPENFSLSSSVGAVLDLLYTSRFTIASSFFSNPNRIFSSPS